MGPESSLNWALRRMLTSSMRFTGREFMSMENSWSRYTVRPSLRVSWNQSLHVTRLPVTLWKYSLCVWVGVCVLWESVSG